MSATQDKSQKATFVYSNLYQIYRKGKEAAKSAEVPVAQPASLNPAATEAPSFAAPWRQNVLKTENLNSAAVRTEAAQPAPKVEEYQPTEFLSKRIAVTPGLRVERPAALPPKRNEAVESLRQNLKQLNDLHSRLRFMLQELEELTKE